MPEPTATTPAVPVAALPAAATPAPPAEGTAPAPVPDGGSPPPEPDKTTQILSRLEELLGRQAAAPATAPVVPPKPAAEPPPTPQGRIKQEDYERMAAYAADQRREHERYKLAEEFGIKPSELEGDFANPQAMRQSAELQALRGQVATLTSSLEVRANTPAPSQEPPVPPVDTGGPSGGQDRATTIDGQMAALRALPPAERYSDASLARALQLQHADPRKLMRVRRRDPITGEILGE